jgi:hypothetical protein
MDGGGMKDWGLRYIEAMPGDPLLAHRILMSVWREYHQRDFDIDARAQPWREWKYVLPRFVNFR